MSVLVLTHQDDAGPGNLLPWLAAARLDSVVCTVPEQGPPDPDGWDSVVVLGSRESVTDAAVGWAACERALIRRCVDTGTPVLGICFGAQQLALVLGGTVERMPTPEFGWTTVTGEEPVAGEWFSWHQDHISAPAGLTELARSRHCLQAYRQGPHLGVQFHPETTGQLHPETTGQRITAWIGQASRVERLVAAGESVDSLRRRTANVLPRHRPPRPRSTRSSSDHFSRSDHHARTHRLDSCYRPARRPVLPVHRLSRCPSRSGWCSSPGPASLLRAAASPPPGRPWSWG